MSTSSGSVVLGRELPLRGRAEPTECGGGWTLRHQEGLTVGHGWRKLCFFFWDQLVPVSSEQVAGIARKRGPGEAGAAGPPQSGRTPALCTSALCSDVAHNAAKELGAEE